MESWVVVCSLLQTTLWQNSLLTDFFMVLYFFHWINFWFRISNQMAKSIINFNILSNYSPKMVYQFTSLMWSPASSVWGIVAERDKFTWTTESCGGKGMAQPLSQGESALECLSHSNNRRAHWPLPGKAFISLICTGIQGIYGKLINHCQEVIVK